MLYREIIAVSSEIHTKNTNKLCWQNIEFVDVKSSELHLNTQSVPRSKHTPSGL
jgi:hypothetical protein